MSTKTLLPYVACLMAFLLMSACAPPLTEPLTPTETPAPTSTATHTPEPTPEPTPTPVEPKTLVICQSEEPESLYLYGGDQQAALHIHQAIYDGPIDNRTYDYQPIILQKLPSLIDGDTVIDTIIVQEGDMVVDAYDEPGPLTQGLTVLPTGCRSLDCAVEFTGEPVEMDQMEVTFKLKEGLLWSDGEPLTAEDSVYGYEIRRDPDTPASKYVTLRTADYEAIDGSTTLWTGLPGYLDSTYFLNFFHPLPRHLWEEELGYTAADLLEAEAAARSPLGWGPFVIQEWVVGDHLTVVQNPNYFRADEGLPYVETVIYRFVNDSNLALTQLLAGECDIVTEDSGLENQADLLFKLDEHGVVRAALSPDTLWEHVNFGINPAPDYNRPDFFQDVRMRQAVAYCLDRQGVMNALLYGRSVVLDSYLAPQHPLYAGQVITPYDYNPERGMDLLDEMGWTDEDGDGIREAHDVEGVRENTPLEFTWTSTSQRFHVAYVEAFREHLAACGMQVNAENLPMLEFFAQGEDGPLYGRAFDVASFAWAASIMPPPCDLYLSSAIPDEDNDWTAPNFPGFSNEVYDQACNRALRSLPGEGGYAEHHLEAQRIFSEELPALPLFLRMKIAAVHPAVSGFQIDPTEASEMWNIEAFDLER
ncbi:MAG: peptide ABC transporter substrate-binding protein [Anaerolineae bacterium]